jgi:hypothetical protein
VRWFGSFLRKNGAKTNSGGEGGLDRPPAAPSAETIPFPRSNAAAVNFSQERSDLNSLDEARAAVRSVFDSLGDQKPAGHAFNVPVVSHTEREQFSPVETGFGAYSPEEDQPAENEWLDGSKLAGPSPAPTHSMSWPRDASERRDFEGGPQQSSLSMEDQQQEEEAPGQWMKGWQAASAAEEYDPDAQLRDALRAHFPERDHAGSEALSVAVRFEEETAQEEFERLGSGRAGPAWTPPVATLDEPDSPPPEPDDAFTEISEGDGSFDPRLFREIEETRGQASHSRRSSGAGGLAVAAAWGLFLCIAGGLIGGFFGFREIAAGALPGLAPLYRTLGMPVTDQPLIFEGVQYEWSTPENRPALNIRGAVYNRARRGVKVPDFFITVKDGDPAFDREYSAKLQVGDSKIRPDEHAEFEIELISPSPSITAIELELRSVR